MKFSFSLFLILFILTSNIKAQWYSQNIDTIGYFGGIKFVNPNVGWVFSNNPSKIYKTTDSGLNWFLQHETDGPFTSTFFLDENYGWYSDLESAGCRIDFTTDGGNTWHVKFQGVYHQFSDFHFFDSSKAIAIGSFGAPGAGAIFKTTNGGTNWEHLLYFQYIAPNSIFFLDSLTGWFGGWASQGVSLFKTIDGGQNWIPLSSSPDGQIQKIQFNNDSIGWVKSDTKLFLTLDGGISWRVLLDSVTDFWFADLNNGWYIFKDKIYSTTNSGLSWELQYSNPGQNLYDLYFFNSQLGWAAGNNGIILHTNNGGTPVELTAFSAVLKDNQVNLNWVTSTEINNRGFEIERKFMDNVFSTIGFVAGHGTTTEEHSYSFIDKNIETGKYFYRLKQIDYDGSYTYTNEIEVDVISLIKFELEQNYPNPFNPSTKIRYAIPLLSERTPSEGGDERGGFVTLKVYDILGSEVAALVNEYKPAGTYEVEFSSNELASGVYYYQLKAGNFIRTMKMIYLK